MEKIYLKRKEDVDVRSLCKRTAMEKDADTVISEYCQIFDEDTWEFIIWLFPISRDTSDLKRALKTIKFQKTKRTWWLESTSRIFWYSPRVAIRNDFCSSTSLSRENPEAHDMVCGYSKQLDEVYRSFWWERYKGHMENTDKVLWDYKIWDSLFTSGIINKNNPLNYHYDAGNFKDCFSCMITIKDGITWWRLSVPEYGIKFELPDSSMIMFDWQSILHWVTPIMKKSESSYRFTCVYYSLKGMWKCLTPDEELIRIKEKKTKLYRERMLKNKK